MSKPFSVAALTALLALLVPGVALAQQAPTRASVRQMLSGVEDVPSDADLQRLGPRVLPILMSLYNDPSEAPYVRMRAVDATAAFPEPGVRSFLLAVARNEGEGDLVVRRALLSLARAFGGGVTEELAGFLDHDQPVVREAAARGLGMVQGETAYAALRRRLPLEQDATVRAALQQALRAAP